MQLLILDAWGPEPLTTEQSRDLLEIVEDRYGRGSLLITSQVPVGRCRVRRYTPSDALLLDGGRFMPLKLPAV